ncbi:gamma-glutamylcyclotransferase family protein [Proteinivorax tanatarense]|uniref:Gamma-glutamylcyclotransferase family protein n=1 Tax=Proteinivorax tanatarense TaxID=1260629 RepID=A0AAU7VKH6_9FIRM
MQIINAAYGSNLNLRQMAMRCPTAKVYGTGVIHDYQLLFKGAPGNAYLTIEPKKGSKVPVVLWELEPEDENALDRYEGYPSFYGKEMVPVELDSGEIVTTMVYVMTDKIPERIHLSPPSHHYLNIVQEGYKEFGLPNRYLGEALEISQKGGKQDG